MTQSVLINNIEISALTEFNRTLLEDYSIHTQFKTFNDITKLNEEGCRKSEFKGFIIALAKDAIYNSTSNLTNQQLDEIMPYLNITEIITTKESDVKLSLIAKFIYNRIRE